MNIVLIGMRGSGKTTVGKLVAQKLGREFIEMDALLAKKGELPIATIVKNHGWPYFRNLESEVAEEVGKLDNVVISCGGGVVVRPENIANLKKNGFLILLRAKIETITSRIHVYSNRPLLTNAKTFQEDLEQVFDQRKILYDEAADFIIDTDKKSIEQVVAEILKAVPPKI